MLRIILPSSSRNDKNDVDFDNLLLLALHTAPDVLQNADRYLSYLLYFSFG